MLDWGVESYNGIISWKDELCKKQTCFSFSTAKLVEIFTNKPISLLPVAVIIDVSMYIYIYIYIYMGADKSLARPGSKQATATEDFEFHISYL